MLKMNDWEMGKGLDISRLFPEPKTSVFDSKKLTELMRNYQHADYQYELIMKSIKEFESTLDDNSEIALHLAAFGQSLVMQVTDVAYSNPSLIHFYGFVNGSKSHLIQHISQLSFLLTAVPKSSPDRPARRIGFVQDED
jgi:hypothetical protein